MKENQKYCQEAFDPFFGKDWSLFCDLANRLDPDSLEQKWGEDYFDILDSHEESVYKLGEYFASILMEQAHQISNDALAEIIKFVAFLFKEAYCDYNAGIGDATPACKWFSTIREKIRPYASQVESYLDHGNLSLRLASQQLIEEWKKAEHFITTGRTGFEPVKFSR